MKKLVLFVMIILGLISLLGAYQSNSIGLNTPSSLTTLQTEINFAHRFYGRFNHDMLDTFFGSSSGANVNVGIRQHLVLGTEAKLNYYSANKKYELGAAWQYAPEDGPVQVQLDLSTASFIRDFSTQRKTDFGIMLSAQNEPLYGRLIFTLNAGYNTYYERLAAGLGTQILLTDDLSILGEFYPLLDDENSSDNVYHVADENAFAFGIAYDLYGHSFIFSLGNDPYHFSTPGHSLGADSKGDLHFGFNVKRRLNFSVVSDANPTINSDKCRVTSDESHSGSRHSSLITFFPKDFRIQGLTRILHTTNLHKSTRIRITQAFIRIKSCKFVL